MPYAIQSCCMLLTKSGKVLFTLRVITKHLRILIKLDIGGQYLIFRRGHLHASRVVRWEGIVIVLGKVCHTVRDTAGEHDWCHRTDDVLNGCKLTVNRHPLQKQKYHKTI